jgi:GR25 family glycosyltransferase involved in LPS biosynthesis
MTQSRTLTAVIIAVDSTPNLERMKNFLSIELEIPTFVISGVTPVQLDCSGLCNSIMDYKKFHCGLTCIEAAISISHSNARNFLLESNSFWGAIFEEDIGFTQEFREFPQMIDSLTTKTSKTKIGFHLIPRQFGIMMKIKSSNLLRVLMLPDCAAGYALNRPALEYISRKEAKHLFLADWPPYFRRIKWFTFKKNLVTHPDLRDLQNFTSTLSEREKRQSARRFSKYVSRDAIRFILLKCMQKIGRNYDDSPLLNEDLRSVIVRMFKVA